MFDTFPKKQKSEQMGTISIKYTNAVEYSIRSEIEINLKHFKNQRTNASKTNRTFTKFKLKFWINDTYYNNTYVYRTMMKYDTESVWLRNQISCYLLSHNISWHIRFLHLFSLPNGIYVTRVWVAWTHKLVFVAFLVEKCFIGIVWCM